MTLKPSCFVIMPFGKKTGADGSQVDFDVVYNQFIHPAVEAAGMAPVRADEETVNGIIHKPMYERLILSDYAVADLTTANANVFYELGIRHAVKPFTTITLFASGSKLPFDLNFLRCMPYDYDTEKLLTNVQANIAALSQQLVTSKNDRKTDSPVYQLVDGIQFQNSVAHEKTDIFRDKVEYDETLKKQLLQIRNKDISKEKKLETLDAFVENIQPLEDNEIGVLIDVMLCYRAFDGYEKMVAFIEKLPVHVQKTVMVREQKAFALNRIDTKESKEEAIQTLEKLIEEKGGSSETYGILGRVYKDLFLKAIKNNQALMADAWYDKALETYMKGFYFDWRDAYPGTNAVMLLELKGETEKINKLAPVVEFAVARKMDSKQPDYWDYASLLELAIIQQHGQSARNYLLKALTCNMDPWMKQTTVNNLQLIKLYRTKRNAPVEEVDEVINALENAE